MQRLPQCGVVLSTNTHAHTDTVPLEERLVQVGHIGNTGGKEQTQNKTKNPAGGIFSPSLCRTLKWRFSADDHLNIQLEKLKTKTLILMV